MVFIADLHIHSKYSRATSRDLSPENLWKWAQLKGISVIGTGDFTHPAWFKELYAKLQYEGNGLFTLRDDFKVSGIADSCKADVFFMLTAEISCIYRKDGRTRKVHSILFVPDFQCAAKINATLAKIGNLNSDGRPILGLDAKELLNIVLEEAPGSMLVPAHAWTPHYSIFGAVSGFDSMEECFEDLTPHIYAIETGLSSDPFMNWRLSWLDGITLISNSDAHSPAKIGREASIFDTDISYTAIMDAIKTRKGFAGTVEFFPQEGKYYNDGHRVCSVSMTPDETLRYGLLCPICGKRVTVGVMHRIEGLADRQQGFIPKNAPPFHSLISLSEIIAEVLQTGSKSKTVEREYNTLLQKLGSELTILMDAEINDIEDAGPAGIGEAVAMMRRGDVHIQPGYDGEYGKVSIFQAS